MKKIYILLFTAFLGTTMIAQTKTVKTTKKVATAKKTTKPVAEVKAVEVPNAFTKTDEHAGHNHDAATTVKPAVDMNKPVTDDNLSLKEVEHNFGKIQQGKPVYYDFMFTNTGKTELKLDNVQASCGCTTPVWKPGPYESKATASINVGFNAGAPGPFEKVVTITYNGSLTKQIKIKGEVVPAPATPAPENPGVQLLKNN